MSREFRSLFKNQEEMKTFLVYGGTDATESQWGRMRASMALMKEANWISFIQVWRDHVMLLACFLVNL